MSWITCFGYHNFTVGDISELGGLYLHTDIGSGIVPINFRVITPFYLNGVDFLDIIYHARRYLAVKMPLECLAGMQIRATKEPKFRLKIVPSRN